MWWGAVVGGVVIHKQQVPCLIQNNDRISIGGVDASRKILWRLGVVGYWAGVLRGWHLGCREMESDSV